ncbi:MAG: hypothetical protein GEU90_18725 [Gemmatimonas sp.]|nr:hypothetical protein [Gemmatimonas sp.]
MRIQYFRPQDSRGINVFEAPKIAGAPYNGFQLDWGAAFTQQFQALDHSNLAVERLVEGVDANRLIEIGPAFNNAAANLYLNAQLAPGIRVALTTYLSSRHHPEAWVKDGYLLVDESPLGVEALENMMKYLTLRVGHFEINYGDAHFRRSDNGNAVFNPFVGNYILDAFTTEIGAEAYIRTGPFLAMGGFTGGEIRGNVTRPEDRGIAYLGKLGVDHRVSPDLRVRFTGSVYTTGKSINNTLYGGDRAGSRYYMVMENTQATESAQFTSGLLNPGLRSEVTAYQVNPFVKFRGLELFGVIEQAEGGAANEGGKRKWNQYAMDVVYRFLAEEQLYVGGRYNIAEGELPDTSTDVGVDRVQLGAGWFVTPNILLKGEYVTQRYNDFPLADIRHEGEFDGLMIEGVVAF